VEQIQVTLVVTVTDVSTFVKIGSEDVGILIDCAVLNNRLFAFADLSNLIKPVIKKIDLEVKGPPLHVIVEITEIRIMIYGLIQGHPTIMFGQLLDQGGFPRSDVSRNGYVFDVGHDAQRPER
jgi:hypothetical protein